MQTGHSVACLLVEITLLKLQNPWHLYIESGIVIIYNIEPVGGGGLQPLKCFFFTVIFFSIANKHCSILKPHFKNCSHIKQYRSLCGSNCESFLIAFRQNACDDHIFQNQQSLFFIPSPQLAKQNTFSAHFSNANTLLSKLIKAHSNQNNDKLCPFL